MTDTACAQPFTCCFFFWGGRGERVKKKKLYTDSYIL